MPELPGGKQLEQDLKRVSAIARQTKADLNAVDAAVSTGAGGATAQGGKLAAANNVRGLMRDVEREGRKRGVKGGASIFSRINNTQDLFSAYDAGQTDRVLTNALAIAGAGLPIVGETVRLAFIGFDFLDRFFSRPKTQREKDQARGQTRLDFQEDIERRDRKFSNPAEEILFNQKKKFRDFQKKNFPKPLENKGGDVFFDLAEFDPELDAASNIEKNLAKDPKQLSTQLNQGTLKGSSLFDIVRNNTLKILAENKAVPLSENGQVDINKLNAKTLEFKDSAFQAVETAKRIEAELLRQIDLGNGKNRIVQLLIDAIARELKFARGILGEDRVPVRSYQDPEKVYARREGARYSQRNLIRLKMYTARSRTGD